MDACMTRVGMSSASWGKPRLLKMRFPGLAGAMGPRSKAFTGGQFVGG